MDTFGERLRKIRSKKGMSQQQLADKTGISISLIGYYERDERNPGSDNIVRIAKTLNVSADFLLGLSEVEHISEEHPVDKINFRRPKIKGRYATDEQMELFCEMYVKMIESLESTSDK